MFWNIFLLWISERTINLCTADHNRKERRSLSILELKICRSRCAKFDSVLMRVENMRGDATACLCQCQCQCQVMLRSYTKQIAFSELSSNAREVFQLRKHESTNHCRILLVPYKIDNTMVFSKFTMFLVVKDSFVPLLHYE